MKKYIYTITALLNIIICNATNAQTKQTRANAKCIAKSYLNSIDNFASPTDSTKYDVSGVATGIAPVGKIYDNYFPGVLPSVSNRLQYNNYAHYSDSVFGQVVCPFLDSTFVTVDANNNILSKKAYKPNGALQGVFFYTYDANSRLQTSYDSLYSDGVNLRKKEYRYQNISGTDLLVSITDKYSANGINFKLDYIDSFIHNPSGDYMDRYEQYQENPSNILKVVIRQVFHRNNQGTVDSTTFYQSNYPYTILDTNNRTYYTRNTNGFINTITRKNWDVSTQQFSKLFKGDTMLYSGINSQPDSAWSYTFDAGFGGMRLTNLYKFDYNNKSQLLQKKQYYSNYPTANTMYIALLEKYYYESATPNGIENMSSQMPLHVYPNPANDYLFINDMEINHHTIVTIYAYDGKVVQQQLLNNHQINISALNSGVYFLNIKSADKMFTAKFVKQ